MKMPILPRQQVAQPLEKTIRREFRHLAGKSRSGKLMPLMAVPFLNGESGLLEQTITFELDPVAGRMISDVYAEVTSIYVPIQAIDAMFNDSDPNAGITELLRRKVSAGTPLFGLENETALSQRLGVNPRSVSGVKKVSPVARLAYNIACNHMRKRRYIYASEITKANQGVSPAIIFETVLDRFNAALDPDEHINGNVQLRLSETQAPVRGINQIQNSVYARATGQISADATGVKIQATSSDAGIFFKRKEGNPLTDQLEIRADLSGVEAEGFSLADLYNSQKADELIRKMREIANSHPEDGEDAVLRWVFGLSTDTGQHPFVLYNERRSLVDMRRNAMDAVGLQDEVSMTYMLNRFDFSVPVPSTELGGIVITIAQVTPDEVIASQPHPILSQDWTIANQAAEQMKIDPELITLRDMYSDITTPTDETNPVAYIGHNGLSKNYSSYGFNRAVDPSTVESKTVLWTYAIPAGVTPSNILYPDTLDQYPFLDQNAEVVTYDIRSRVTVATPMFFGPSPVEKVAIVDTNDLLGEDEE